MGLFRLKTVGKAPLSYGHLILYLHRANLYAERSNIKVGRTKEFQHFNRIQAV